MSEPLTLAEAVPLGTVHLQRLLTAAGIRSLVIKGPAFVELGVRRPKQSNDIDLLIAPEDVSATREALRAAAWSRHSAWYPRALDDVTNSTTYSHDLFPVTVDVHDHISGLLADEIFEAIWQRRSVIRLANCEVSAPGRDDAFIIEGVNALKAFRPEAWPDVSQRLVDAVEPLDTRALVACAESLGASETFAPVLARLGVESGPSEPSKAYVRWMDGADRDRRKVLFRHLLLRAPWAIPAVVVTRLSPTALRNSVAARGRQSGRHLGYLRLLARRLRLLFRTRR